MLDFPLIGQNSPKVSILISKIVGVAQLSNGSVTIYVEGGFRFDIADDYAAVHAKIRNATSPRPY